MLLIPYECKGHILSPAKQLRPLFYINFYCDPEPCCNNFWRMLAVGEGLSVANFFVSHSCYRQLFPMKRLQSTTPGLLLCCARRQLSWESPNQKERSWRKPKDVILRPRHRSERNQSRNARSRRRALIRAILFYLCSRKGKATNLQTDVSQKDLARAEEFAQKFKRDYLTNCPMRDRAGFYSAYGDLLTRKGQYEEGLYSFNVCILEVHNMILIQW